MYTYMYICFTDGFVLLYDMCSYIYIYILLYRWV